MEHLCERDVGFRVVAANNAPDHTTIARSRKDNAKNLEKLFTEALRLCQASGLVRLGLVATPRPW
ncbi:MAG: transposase [Chloroflexi bacterium]|nr:transposase [Chloroflexota bacterium]